MNVFAFFLFTLYFADTFCAKTSPLCPQIKIKFGRVRYRQRGKIARFLCNTGYTLAGDRYSVCIQNRWDNTLPKCVRATCKNAKPPVNGLIYPSHGGAVLNFYCKSNYQLKGSSITYCDGDKWDNALPTCTATNSTPPLSCDFEREDLCGWNHDLNHDFDWTRMNYATPSGSIGTGPAHDHTKGAGKDGFYMYIESSARNVNDTARLISPVFDRTTDNVCFEFYYHMYGVTTGDLRVYLKKVNQTWNFDPKNAVFAKNGNQGNRWFRAFLDLGSLDDDFQIIIEGVRGSSYVSDIAIDDVRVIKSCVPELDDAITTTEESSSEPPISVESCENRCNTTDEQTTEYLITCDCDDRCFDRRRCCPDYFDYCVMGTSPDDFDDLFTSTITSTPQETPPSTKQTTVSSVPSTTIQVTGTSTITTKIATRKKESKIVYVTPDDVDEVPIEKSDDDYEAPIKETEIDSGYDNDKTVNQKIVILSKMTEHNTKTVIFAVGVVFGVLFAAVGTAFVARRYRLFGCNSLRRINQSANGDSQSDVRFLTSDEVLDLNLPAGYDTL